MAKRGAIDRETKRAILDARSMMQAAEKADSNEAETRRRIERLFESLMGFDAFQHLSRERAVRGAGETEHVDFAIHIDEGENPRPLVMVEIKRVAIDLAKKHLKQVASYAIDAGCEWALLTNGREWKLHHVSFGQPPETRLVRSWNLLTDDVAQVAAGFELISLKSLKRGSLDDVWRRTNVLLPRNLLEAVVSDPALSAIRRDLRKRSGVLLPPEDIVAGLRRMLNESALSELEGINITLTKPKRRRRTISKGSGGSDDTSDLDEVDDDRDDPKETAEGDSIPSDPKDSE